MAHELRTPLTSLAATATLLEDELDDLTPRSRKLAGLLVREIRRLRDLALELLELSRLDSGSEPVHLEALHLRLAIDTVLTSLDGIVSEPVVVDVDPDLVVLADRSRLRRILTNVLANALVHGEGRVEIRASDDPTRPERVMLEVADHGPGIAEADLPHVFDRFFKSDRSRARGGSGLGLAIANQHARALGAPLAVRNRPGGGAVFTLHLHRSVSRGVPIPADDTTSGKGESSERGTHLRAP